MFPSASRSSFLFEHDLFGKPDSTFPDHALGPQHSGPPTIDGDASPYRLHQAERPRALQKAVDRAQRAGRGEGENEPRAAILQRIEDQHGGDGRETEKTERTHVRRGDIQRGRRSRPAAFKPQAARRAPESAMTIGNESMIPKSGN